MSVPARGLPQPAAQPWRGRPDTEPVPASRRPAARPHKDPPPQRRARRGHHRGFWLLSAALVSGLLLAQVALNGFLIDATYRMHTVGEQMQTLDAEHEQLRTQVAQLSSPDRIARWAQTRGMVMPDPGDVIVVAIKGSGEPTTADGAGPTGPGVLADPGGGG